MFGIGENVYHYTKAKTASENILDSLTIKMGPFHRLNDPREAKIWPFKFYSHHSSTNPSFDKTLFEKASECVTNRTLILCCTTDLPHADINNIDIDMQMGYGHSRMWSQYADQHKGVCLVLDKKKMHESIENKLGRENLYFGGVKYGYPMNQETDPYGIVYLEDIMKAGVHEFIDKHIEKYADELFFTKHQDWRDEWEYRWVFRSKNDDPTFIPIANTLKAVILGSDCPLDISNSIVANCKLNNVSVFRAYWHGWSLSLFGNLCDNDFDKRFQVSLNGVSFSTKIPCGGVFLQGINSNGGVQPILIENNGDVKII